MLSGYRIRLDIDPDDIVLELYLHPGLVPRQRRIIGHFFAVFRNNPQGGVVRNCNSITVFKFDSLFDWQKALFVYDHPPIPILEFIYVRRLRYCVVRYIPPEEAAFQTLYKYETLVFIKFRFAFDLAVFLIDFALQKAQIIDSE